MAKIITFHDQLQGRLEQKISAEKEHPFRKPDWRWTLAGSFTRPIDVSECDWRRLIEEIDEPLGACVALRERLFESSDGNDLDDLEPRLSDYDAARQLWLQSAEDLANEPAGIPISRSRSRGRKKTGASGVTPIVKRHRLLTKWEVEARILARMPCDKIADKVGDIQQVVQAYEASFFNVTDRIDASSWITRWAIRLDPERQLRLPNDFDLIMRHSAYWKGLPALELLIEHREIFLDPYGQLSKLKRSTDEIETILELICDIQLLLAGHDPKRLGLVAEIGLEFSQLQAFRHSLESSETALRAAMIFLAPQQ